MTFARSARFALPALCTLALSACGGAQTPGDGDSTRCADVEPEMSDAALQAAVTCHANTPSETSAAACRAALSAPSALSVEALGDAARCMLTAGERTDGAVLAEAFNASYMDPTRTRALMFALGVAFESRTHGNTFGVTVMQVSQDAIGAELTSVDAATRLKIVELATAYRLSTLLGHCGPWLRELGADSPGVQAYAQTIDTAQPLNEADRWALAVSGEWTAEDIIDCFDHSTSGCADWQGESPLALLDDAPIEVGDARVPSRLLTTIRTQDVDAASVQATAHFLSTAQHANRGNFVNTMLAEMTNPDRTETQREAVASAASAELCDFRAVRATFRRAGGVYSDGATREDTAWSHFISQCSAQYWNANENLGALMYGSFTYVPPSVREAIAARAAEQLEGETCAAAASRLPGLYAWAPTNYGSGLGVTALARAMGSACVGQLSAAVRAVADDSDQYPEGRIDAFSWLLEHDVANYCGDINQALRWHSPELGLGASDEARSAADALRAQCN